MFCDPRRPSDTRTASSQSLFLRSRYAARSASPIDGAQAAATRTSARLTKIESVEGSGGDGIKEAAANGVRDEDGEAETDEDGETEGLWFGMWSVVFLRVTDDFSFVSPDGRLSWLVDDIVVGVLSMPSMTDACRLL